MFYLCTLFLSICHFTEAEEEVSHFRSMYVSHNIELRLEANVVSIVTVFFTAHTEDKHVRHGKIST